MKMWSITNQPAYSFDDVLLIPQHSSVASRGDVDLTTHIGNIELSLPIISANMDSVTEVPMAIAMSQAGGLGILHRFAPADKIWDWVKACQNVNATSIISLGVDIGRSMSLIETTLPYLNGVCVDVAHGDHQRACDVVQIVRKDFKSLNIIAGNVATPGGALRLVDAGANVIKVGVGPGSLCTTRVVSGHGFPQLSAIDEVVLALTIEGRRENNDDHVSIIADGGIRYPGDIVKALAVGADAVMVGSLLAGTDEAAGERIIEHGVAYKTYRGMASREVQKEKRSDKTPRIEGVAAKVPYRGPVRDTLDNLEAGIRSGFSYSGARNLTELRNKARFVVVTGNTLKENHPHHPYVL